MKTKRRVYVLPENLVARIVEFQKTTGMTSEVEAVRKLLNEALMASETIDQISDRVLMLIEKKQTLSDALKEVVVGHPKVLNIFFDKISASIQFANTEEEISFFCDGRVNRDGYYWENHQWHPIETQSSNNSLAD